MKLNLTQFGVPKTEEFIRIGLHDLGGSIDIEQILEQLSDLADAVVECALQLTLEELQEKFGIVPQGRFAVLGWARWADGSWITILTWT